MLAKSILVFLYPGCAEFEITIACWQIAESEQYEIMTIAYDYEPILTNSGFTMVPERLVSNITVTENIAGLIIPGGSLLDLRIELQVLLQNLDKQKKLLSAICAGPQYLAASGIINSKLFTTSRTPEMYLERNELDPFVWKNYQEKRVVVDKNLITAKGFAFSDFALAIWDYLGLITSDEERNEWRLKFFPQTLNNF